MIGYVERRERGKELGRGGARKTVTGCGRDRKRKKRGWGEKARKTVAGCGRDRKRKREGGGRESEKDSDRVCRR